MPKAKKKTSVKTSAKKTKVAPKKVSSKKDYRKSLSMAFMKAKTNTKTNKKLWVIAAVVVILAALFFAKSLFIAAIVNGQPISRFEVIKQLEAQGGTQTLDTLIAQALVLGEAKKRNITVSQSDIDKQVATIEAQVQSQGSSLDSELATQGMSRADFTDQVKLKLLLDKMINQNVTVSDKDVSDYVAANSDQFPNGVTASDSAQIKDQIKQQKISQAEQDFVQNLRTKAKITYLVNY